MSLQLILPKSALPAFKCNICDKPFYDNERNAWMNHTIKCADDHHDELMASMPREKMRSLIEAGDQELENWVKRNRIEILQGKKKIGKP